MTRNLALYDLGSDGLALITRHLRDYDVHALARACKKMHSVLMANFGLPNKACAPPGELSDLVEEDDEDYEKENYVWKGCYRDGKRHGEWRSYIDGEMVCSVNYCDGVMHGDEIQTWPGMHRVRYVRGVREGEYECGNPAYSVTRGVYRNGLIDGPVHTIKQYELFGGVETYRRGVLHGVYINIHPRWRIKKNYLDGRRHGETMYWRLSHEPKVIIHHDGPYIHEMRPLKFAPSKVEYHDNGVRCGKWIWWRRDGTIRRCRRYENGQIAEESCEYIE